MKKISVNEELIARFLSGNITNEEQRVLFGWLNESPDNKKQLFVLKDIYDVAAKERLFKEADTQEGWKQLQLQLSNRKKPKSAKVVHWITYMIRYAAVLLIGIAGTAACYHFYAQEVSQQKTFISTYRVTTDKGERATVTLPDGSIVRLNACSSISYQSDYGQSDRDVVFSGEAYFEIQTNADIPFAVKTYGLYIKAYGTTFNVKAYPDEEMIETTLVNGVVLIEDENNNEVITLKPNQVISIPKTSHRENNQTGTTSNEQMTFTNKKNDSPIETNRRQTVLRKNVKTEEYISWKEDKWIINAESLESLAKKIERRYDVSVLIEDEASKKYVFSGTLRNYPLEQVLEVIRLNAPIQFAIKEKNVIIKEEKQLKKQYQNLIYSE